MSDPFDLFIIGGGINGAGIARDAAGRGLSVCLAEKHDLAGATSSASTKLFHGGLRYLEFFEFDLVRKALIERETLLKAMPHISWPMRFVLPLSPEMRFDSDTPTSRLLSFVMPWMKRPAAGLADPPGAVSLRPSRRAGDPARHRPARPDARAPEGAACRIELPDGLRVFRLPGCRTRAWWC